MSTMFGANERLQASILAFLIVGLSACSILSSKSIPAGVQLDLSDLPKYFYLDGYESRDVSDALTSRLVSYLASSSQGYDYLFVKQQMTLYESVEDARRGFDEMEDRRFPTEAWISPQEVDFRPASKRDLYRDGCIHSIIDGEEIQSCLFLQQHDELVSLVIVNIDGRYINFEMVNSVLMSVDRRLNGGELPQDTV